MHVYIHIAHPRRIFLKIASGCIVLAFAWNRECDQPLRIYILIYTTAKLVLAYPMMLYQRRLYPNSVFNRRHSDALGTPPSLQTRNNRSRQSHQITPTDHEQGAIPLSTLNRPPHHIINIIPSTSQNQSSSSQSTQVVVPAARTELGTVQESATSQHSLPLLAHLPVPTSPTQQPPTPPPPAILPLTTSARPSHLTLKTILQSFDTAWFIVGNYWLLTSHVCSPWLYYQSLIL